MPSIQNFSPLATRDTETKQDNSHMIDLSITILGLVFFILVLFSLLFLFRRLKQQQRMRAAMLPTYQEAQRGSHHGLTIQTTQNGRSSVFVINKDGQPMLMNPGSPPHSPDNVPEIHITFPDEQDSHGRQKNGRVVVVRVGEATVGLGPVKEEQLPAYEKDGKNQFHSIDMDQIGGLKEKDRTTFR
jgi:cbb3-type cytochrome oxidase subunit 3